VADRLRFGRHRPLDALHGRRSRDGEGIEVVERVEALALIHDGHRCHGAIVAIS